MSKYMSMGWNMCRCLCECVCLCYFKVTHTGTPTYHVLFSGSMVYGCNNCTLYCIVSTGQTCPTVQGTATEQNCTDECSSDDDCQYDRICCSNGCGGRVCSDSVEMCQVSSIVRVSYVI